jgi:hypothetical protein
LTRSSSLGIAPPCHTRKVPKPRRLALCRGFPRRLALCRGLCSLLLHSLATTRAPHSPFAAGPGHHAASGPLVVEVASFISAPNPQHKAPKRTPPSIRKHLSITTSPSACTNSHALIAPAALSPLLCRRASTSRQHTRSHTLSSPTLTHNPPQAAPSSLAHLLVQAICRGLLLQRTYHDSHATLTWHHWQSCRCRVRSSCHCAILLQTCQRLAMCVFLVRASCRRGSLLHTCPR